MKKALLILITICGFASANAQQDSIMVVIECDSLYRPFVECSGFVTVDTNTKDNFIWSDRSLRFNRDLVCKIPLPLDKSGQYNIYVEFSSSIGSDYFPSYFLSVNQKNWGFMSFDNEGRALCSQTFSFGKDSIIMLHITDSCSYSKYLINNTCPSCNEQDNVSWIVHGSPVEDPITGQFPVHEICNPYNNPRSKEDFYGGCSPEPCHPHWYCHRCKKEY